nr:transposase [Opitutus terrae]
MRPDSLWRDDWWVHIQPAGSGTSVLRYLACYVQRTAISDERIVQPSDEAITLPLRVAGDDPWGV